jgi:hypothetical protein
VGAWINPVDALFHIYGICGILAGMAEESIRTTIDIPAPIYRKLKEQAAARGSSVRELVLAGVKRVLVNSRRSHPRKVHFPLIDSKGPKVNVTNEVIYEHVEFP